MGISVISSSIQIMVKHFIPSHSIRWLLALRMHLWLFLALMSSQAVLLGTCRSWWNNYFSTIGTDWGVWGPVLMPIQSILRISCLNFREYANNFGIFETRDHGDQGTVCGSTSNPFYLWTVSLVCFLQGMSLQKPNWKGIAFHNFIM